jgi:predicted dienelactone hydrolase
MIMYLPVKRPYFLIVLAVLAACTGDPESGTGGISGGEIPIAGPYPTVREDTDSLIYFFPEEIEEETSWPSLVWFNGASGYAEDFNYNGLLQSIASWGFVVVGGKSPGMTGPETDQRAALLTRNQEPDDVLFGRIDADRIALAGHSLGGFQTTEESGAYTTAIAIQGAGTPRADEAAPTLFMTSQGDEVVSSSVVQQAFDRAINDAWLASHATADHNDPRTDGGVFREPVIAFLRWKLYDDDAGAAWFQGEGCVLCSDPLWSLDTR